MATLDLTIVSGKGIKITTGAGGIFYIRSGNKSSFFADKTNQQYYFNYRAVSAPGFDWCLKWADIGTYNGAASVPSYDGLAQEILAEIDAE